MKKRIAMACAGIAAICGLLFTACNKEKKPEAETLAPIAESGDVVELSFSYNNSYGQCGYNYDIEKDGEEIIFSYMSDQYYNYDEMSCSVDQKVLDALSKLYEEHHLAKWNGYNEVDENVTDGDGFSLDIKLEDGTRMSAYGSNAFPEGYRDVQDALDELLNPYAEKLLEEKRQEFIAEGFPGNVDSIMVNFMEHGNSGSDSYEFFILESQYRDKNFDARIKSTSGEFLPEGEYKVYEAVNDDEIPFAEVKELIQKYDMVQWYDYNETAEDYANEEWFQISIGFDDGKALDACGTKHPEHYEEFREEFLKLMCEQVQKVSNK